ncbi:MAG: TetR-like C-terminal domain-containing protein, partial [Eubacteriales bacterium]|nr:TetR-like C-terminal domain-containing protein [Eubacteriales bacterium]
FFSFLVGGCCSLLQYWFSTGMRQSPKELADITVTFLNRNTAD